MYSVRTAGRLGFLRRETVRVRGGERKELCRRRYVSRENIRGGMWRVATLSARSRRGKRRRRTKRGGGGVNARRVGKGNDNSRDYAEMRGVAFVKRCLK